MSDNIQVGRKVLFIGGPDAGNIRIVPESHGDMLQADHDYVYRVWPVAMAGTKQKIFFAYAADQHPIKMFIDMWRDYSPTAQIRRGATEAISYQRVGSGK